MQTIKLTPEQYHSHKFDKSRLPDLANAGYISASLVAELKNPLNFLMSEPKKQTSAMNWGGLVDCLWTTPHLFGANYLVMPSNAPRRPTEAQKTAKKPTPASVKSVQWWEEFERQAMGRTVISEQDHHNALRACTMLDRHPIAKELKDASLKQLALMGPAPKELQLPEGAKTKSLLDLLPTEGRFVHCVPDLKTTNDLAENLLHNTVVTYDYVVKIAFYCIMAEAAGYGPRNTGALIWSRSVAPFDVKVRLIEPNDIMFGKSLIIKRLAKLQTMKPNVIEPFIESDLRSMKLQDWAINEYNAE